MKVCHKCNTKKELTEFRLRKNSRTGKAAYESPCKACLAAYAKTYRETREGTEIRKTNRRLYMYNVTEERLQALWEEQDGECAICPLPITLESKNTHVDHDHDCCPGERSCGLCVRGLLCGSCNRGLGLFRDDADSLELAAAYVRLHKKVRDANTFFDIVGPIMDAGGSDD